MTKMTDKNKLKRRFEKMKSNITSQQQPIELTPGVFYKIVAVPVNQPIPTITNQIQPQMNDEEISNVLKNNRIRDMDKDFHNILEHKLFNKGYIRSLIENNDNLRLTTLVELEASINNYTKDELEFVIDNVTKDENFSLYDMNARLELDFLVQYYPNLNKAIKEMGEVHKNKLLKFLPVFKDKIIMEFLETGFTNTYDLIHVVTSMNVMTITHRNSKG